PRSLEKSATGDQTEAGVRSSIRAGGWDYEDANDHLPDGGLRRVRSFHACGKGQSPGRTHHPGYASRNYGALDSGHSSDSSCPRTDACDAGPPLADARDARPTTDARDHSPRYVGPGIALFAVILVVSICPILLLIVFRSR